MRRWFRSGFLSSSALVPSLLAAGPLTQGLATSPLERHAVRVIVCTPDAVTVAARAQRLFAAEGLDVGLIVTPNSTVQRRGLSDGADHVARSLLAGELQVSEQGAAQRLAQLLPAPEPDREGLQSVLELCLRFGYQPPLGPELARYRDLSYLR